MKNLKVTELKKAAKELNEFLELEPAIDVKSSKDELIEEISKACDLIDQDENEQNELSKGTKKVFDAWLESQEDEVDEDEVDKDEGEDTQDTGDLTLREEVENADLAELKKIIKKEEVFSLLKKGLALQKNEEKLRARCIAVLDEEEKEEPKDRKLSKPSKEELIDSKKNKKGKSESSEKRPAVQKAEGKKGKGVIATIVEAVEKADKKGISRQEVHEILVADFPDRAEKSLMNTIKVQLPNRIHKEKFELEAVSDGRWKKA